MASIHVTGLVLTVGAVLFMIGAGLAPEPMRVFSAPRLEHLQIVQRNRARWGWMNGLMSASTIVTAVGLFLLAGNLGAGAGPTGGAIVFMLGGVVWLLALNFRDTVTIHAAEESGKTGTVPAWFEPLEAWVGRMFWIYMVLAYLAIAAFGWCLTSSHLLPAWIGWFAFVYGVVFELAFIARFPETFWGPLAEPPFLVHVPVRVIGIGLLSVR